MIFVNQFGSQSVFLDDAMLRFLVFFLFASHFALGQVPTSAGLDLVVTSEPTPSLIVTADNQIGSPPLRRDDAIIAIDGKPVFSLSDLGRPEFCRNDGSVFILTVIRPVLGAMRNPVIAGPNCMRVAAVIRRIVRPVVEVRSVAPQSPAYAYGLQAGDILLAADGKALYGPPEEMQSQTALIVSAMTSTAGVALLFSRNGTIYEQKPRAALSSPNGSVTSAQSSATNTAQPLSSAQAAVPSVMAEPRPPANPVVTVQEFLRSQQDSHKLTVTGTWNPDTQENVGGFIEYLQKITLAGQRWNGPADGLYSDAYASFLGQAVAAMKNDPRTNQAFAAQLEGFMLAMNELKRTRVYSEEQARPTQIPSGEKPIVPVAGSPYDLTHTPSTQKADSGDVILPAFLWFANGALSEFGDELWCGLTHGGQSFSACHAEAKITLERFDEANHIMAQICYFAGTFMNPITLILIAFGKQTETGAFGAMFLSLILGVVDFFLYTIGDWWTKGSWHDVDLPQMFASAVIAALLTAFAIATHEHTSSDGTTRHVWREDRRKWWQKKW